MLHAKNEDIPQPSASLSHFKLVLAIYPNTGPRQSPSRGQGTLLIPPAWHQRPSHSSSQPPSLPLSFPGHGKMPRSEHGWAEDGRKERWASISGTFSNLKCRKRPNSTFSREGWWRTNVEGCVTGGVGIGCCGTGDTFVSPVCQHRGGGTRVVLHS